MDCVDIAREALEEIKDHLGAALTQPDLKGQHTTTANEVKDAWWKTVRAIERIKRPLPTTAEQRSA